MTSAGAHREGPLHCQREAFSIPSGHHYLNCAYMSPLSRRVQEAGAAGIRREALPYEIRSPDFFAECDQVRERFAALLGAPDPISIAIVPSASYAIAQVARNTPVARGQNIVTVGGQFPSNVYIWRRVASEVGAEVRAVRRPTDGTGPAAAWSEAVVGAIDDATAVVAVESVHWTDGTRFDIGRIADRAHQCGAAVLVDATQSLGVVPFDFAAVRPDAVVCAGYKWLMGPYSIGAAYFGPRYERGTPIEESWLAREGSGDFRRLAEYRETYREGATRYDVGETANFVLMPMFRTALEEVLARGPARVEAYARALTGGLLQELHERSFGVAAADARVGHLFGLRMPAGTDVAAVSERLHERRVYVSVRGDAVRVSVHVYNDDEDVAALREALLG